MTHTFRVRVDVLLADDLHHPVGKVTLVRQALLTLLDGIIRSIPDGQISVTVRNEGSGVCILIQPEGPFPSGAPVASAFEGLETAQQLIELSGGSLQVLASEKWEGLGTIHIALPSEEQVRVLVIDDNVDTLRLLRRYLSNSRYRFVGTSDPHQALQSAEDSVPQIIVLDVMLPEVDGWELLGRLRQHPKTCDIPVVVCTILPQEELALNLGAADFVQKPVSRAAFLAALDRQKVSPSKECS
jgi:CheY-like chemotaxis protein